MKRIFTFLLEYFRNISNPAISIFSRVENSLISKRARIYRNVKLISSSVGDYSYIAPKTTVLYATIGKFCSIGQSCNIGLAKHPISFISTSPIFFSPNNATGIKWVEKNLSFEEFEAVNIENDVWIGNNATIMGGITIGNGAIVGTGAVVTKSVPPYAIVGGVPAKILRYRFDNAIIEQLQASKWWNKADSELKSKIESFQTKEFCVNSL